jgi:hypothetical protein
LEVRDMSGNTAFDEAQANNKKELAALLTSQRPT